MEQTFRIRALKFNRPAWNQDHQVEAELVVGEERRSLSVPSQTFRPSTYAEMPTQGAGWSTTAQVGVLYRLSLSVRLITAGVRQPRAVTFYWQGGHDIGTVRLAERAFTVVFEQIGPRRTEGRVTYVSRGSRGVTVATERPVAYVELDPCVPRPAGPGRPRRWSYPLFVDAASSHVQRLPEVTDPSMNPAVIPASDGDPTPAWRDTWLARYQLQFLAHNTDYATIARELVWSFEPIEARASAQPRGPSQGGFVSFVGGGEGEGRVIVSRHGNLLSAVRVLVKRPRSLPLRFEVLVPPPGHPQRDELEAIDARAVNRVVRDANRYLRQVAVRLEEVETVTKTEVPASDTSRVSFDRLDAMSASRGSASGITVLVIAAFTDAARGYCAGIPENRISNLDRREEDGSVSCLYRDEGSPSTSWIRPDGLPPLEERSRPTPMRFIRRGRMTRAVLWLSLTGEPSGFRGKTLAHEVGHSLNLAHREAPLPREASGFEHLVSVYVPDDQVEGYGHRANLMCAYGGDGDLDIAQAKVIWASPLLGRGG